MGWGKTWHDYSQPTGTGIGLCRRQVSFLGGVLDREGFNVGRHHITHDIKYHGGCGGAGGT